jgi:regulator of sirC expression with transglutaminase-like and TPR domain
MDNKNLTALLSLLKDPDPATFETIADSLTLDIPTLENLWRQADDEIALSRLDLLIHQARFKKLEKALDEWQKNRGLDIVEGACLLASYQFPDLSFKEVEDEIAKLAKDVWMELNGEMTPLETVDVINRVLFEKHGFQADEIVESVTSLNHIFINDVLRSKKGSRTGLGLIYLGVANRLAIPIFPSMLPFGLILAWENDNEIDQSIDFYIDPFEKGKILDKQHFINYMVQQNLPLMPELFYPCSIESSIILVINDLMMRYEINGLHTQAQERKTLVMKLIDVS